MAHDVISICPVCSGDLTVSRLHCGSCGTTLEGEFSVGRFSRLGRDQMTLLESFLRSRGNLREVESILSQLGRPEDGTDPAAAAEPAARQAILERLARREISADDAATEIRALRRTER